MKMKSAKLQELKSLPAFLMKVCKIVDGWRQGIDQWRYQQGLEVSS